MKVIFLDFDGVLNSQGWRDRQLAATGRGWDQENWVNHIDPQAVARFGRLVEETAAMVVVASSWRIVCDVEEMQRWVETRGAYCNIIGRTPGSGEAKQLLARWTDAPPYTGRGSEIEAWIRTWNAGDPCSQVFWPRVGDRLGRVTHFVILDDSSDLEPHLSRHVRTCWDVGLTDSDVDIAIDILRRPL